jgi:hypothetical protein
MPSAGFEPVIPANERPKIYAFHRKTTGRGIKQISANVMRLVIFTRKNGFKFSFFNSKFYDHYACTASDFRPPPPPPPPPPRSGRELRSSALLRIELW